MAGAIAARRRVGVIKYFLLCHSHVVGDLRGNNNLRRLLSLIIARSQISQPSASYHE
jgi:hypothetical protein